MLKILCLSAEVKVVAWPYIHEAKTLCFTPSYIKLCTHLQVALTPKLLAARQELLKVARVLDVKLAIPPITNSSLKASGNLRHLFSP